MDRFFTWWPFFSGALIATLVVALFFAIAGPKEYQVVQTQQLPAFLSCNMLGASEFRVYDDRIVAHCNNGVVIEMPKEAFEAPED